MPKTVYLDTVLLNHVLRNTAYSSPTAVYVALYTTTPTPTTTGVEVSSGAYTRQPVTFGDPVSGTTSNTADVVFPTASATWGTVVAYAIMDDPTGGNMLYYAPFAAPRLIDVNDDARFPVGQLMVTEG